MSCRSKPFQSHFVKDLDEFKYSIRSGCGQMMTKLLTESRNLYQNDLLAHYGCVNAIEFSPHGDLLASGGDDRRLLLWKVQSILDNNPSPSTMKGGHCSNIFCIAFSNNQKTIFSAGNDEQVLLHDVETGKTRDIFRHTDALYGLSVDPLNDNVFASASDDGKVLIWDIREPPSAEPFCLARHKAAFYSVMYNPVESSLIATANNKYGVALWDIRKPYKCCLMKYGGTHSCQSAMSIRFNSIGTKILALRRRLPPILYDIHSSDTLHEFDSPGYYNSCTMKSCCFAGYNDEYVLSGSDDYKLYMWKIPSEPTKVPVQNSHMILKGHRSIVNQVRFNSSNFLIASSGVEKIVKLWSVFPTPGCKGSLNKELKPTNSRKLYSPEDYINLLLNSEMFMTHDYSHHSVHEDARMMAFFDSLVQRDVEGWVSDSTDSLTQDDPNWEVTRITSDSDGSSSSSDNESCSSHQYSPNCCPRLLSSDSENSGSVSNDESKKTTNSANKPLVEISDLSQRIATMRRDMKNQAKSSLKKKKIKKNVRKSKQKNKRVILSSTSGSDDENNSSGNVQFSHESNPNRGFFTLDSILGPPVWYRISEDTDPNDRRRELRRKRTRILMNRSDSDSDRSNTETRTVELSNESKSVKPENDIPVQSATEKNHVESSDTSDRDDETIMEASRVSDSSELQPSSSVGSNSARTDVSSVPDNSDAGPSSSSSNNNNITWAEFKRFKNRVKRASRHYRKHRSSNANNSD